MLLLTNDFFIMHLLSYSQKLDHILWKSDACIAFCYFKLLGFDIAFLTRFCNSSFSENKRMFSEYMTNDQEVLKEQKNYF